jgi:hypothetical protein
MKAKLDIDIIIKGLGAERMGKVVPSGGYFGALQIVADIKARFRVPAGGGRPTDPNWTEKRLLPLRPRTLKRLEKLTARIRGPGGIKIEVMQFAALLLEKEIEQLSLKETKKLVQHGLRANR